MIHSTITGIIQSDPKRIEGQELVTFEVACQTIKKTPEGKWELVFITVESWNKHLNKGLLTYSGNKKGCRTMVIGNLYQNKYMSKKYNKEITKWKLKLDHIESIKQIEKSAYDE